MSKNQKGPGSNPVTGIAEIPHNDRNHNDRNIGTRLIGTRLIGTRLCSVLLLGTSTVPTSCNNRRILR